MHRRWLRWGLWTIGVIVVLLAVAYFVIESSWGRERVLAVMVDRANRAMRGELRVEALHGSVLGDATFRGVTLTLNGETVFAADSVRAEFSVWQLMFDEVGLEALTVIRPRIRATETDAGWNIAKVLPERDPDAPRSKFEFSIDRVAVIDGDVEVRPQGAEARRMQNVQLETAFDYSGGTVAMEVDRAELNDPDADVALRSFDGMVQIGDAGVAVSDMHAVTAASEVQGDVAYATNGENSRELRFAVEAPKVAVREIAAYVPALRKYRSDTMVTATARGTLAEMTADWTLESSAGRGRGRIEGGQRNGAMTLRGEADVAGFDPSAWLDNRSLEGRLDARGNFALAWQTENPAATMEARFDATVSSVQLAGYSAANLRSSGTFARGTLNATAAAQAYGATIDGRGTWQQRSNTWSARGRFANVNLRALPRSLQVPALASRLSGEASLSGGPSRFVAEATLAESVVEDATIAQGHDRARRQTGQGAGVCRARDRVEPRSETRRRGHQRGATGAARARWTRQCALRHQCDRLTARGGGDTRGIGGRRRDDRRRHVRADRERRPVAGICGPRCRWRTSTRSASPPF